MSLDGKAVSKFEKNFSERKNIKYYLDKKGKVPLEKAGSIYSSLEKTDFVSLYAATNMYDDFAELFAVYVHTIIYKKQFKIEIYNNGKLIKSFMPNLKDNKYKIKLDYMNNILIIKYW